MQGKSLILADARRQFLICDEDAALNGDAFDKRVTGKLLDSSVEKGNKKQGLSLNLVLKRLCLELTNNGRVKCHQTRDTLEHIYEFM